MKIPLDIQQKILEIRRDNPQLTVDMSDEDVIVLLQQADLTLEIGKPMTFLNRKQGSEEKSSGLPDPLTMSAQECNAYGEQLLDKGKWFEAERYFLAQYEKSKAEGNLEQQAYAYRLLATLYSFRGNMDQAVSLYHLALSTAEQIHHLRLIGIINNDLGELCRRQGDYGQAIGYYKKSLEIALNTGNEGSLAVIYGNLGIVYKNQSQFEQAVWAYEKSLEFSKKNGIDRLTANQYGNLGVVYALQGRYDAAIEMHEKSMEIGERLGNYKTMADAYGNLGLVKMHLGNYLAAKDMYQKSLAIMQSMGDEPGVALTFE